MQVTLYEEISAMQPKEIPLPIYGVNEIRQMRENKQVKDDEYFKFWGKDENKVWLEEKWQAELHNKDCFIRLHELYQTCQDSEKPAVLAKLTQFKNHINRFETFKALRIDWQKFPFTNEIPKEAQTAAARFGGEVEGWE